MMTGISGGRLAAIDVERHVGFYGGLVGNSAVSVRMLGSQREPRQWCDDRLTPSERWAGDHLAQLDPSAQAPCASTTPASLSTFRALRRHSHIGGRFLQA